MTLQTVVLHTLCSFHPTSGRYTRVLLAINQIIIQTTCRWKYEYSRNTAAVTVFSLGHTALLRAIPMHVYTGPTKPADQRTLPFLQASSHSQVTRTQSGHPKTSFTQSVQHYSAFKSHDQVLYNRGAAYVCMYYTDWVCS